MELTDFEICNRIAEIEGVKIKALKWSFELVFYEKKPFELSEYNPLTDKALNCELRDKHNVEVNYGYKTCSIYAYSYFDDGGLSSCASIVSAEFNSKEEIPRAVLLCIIEAKDNEY